MAEGTLTHEPAYVATLAAALARRLDNAQISREPVRGDRYRFIVVSDQFAEMGHPERQRLVWEVADETLSKGDLLKVGMIITISPNEVPSA